MTKTYSISRPCISVKPLLISPSLLYVLKTTFHVRPYFLAEWVVFKCRDHCKVVSNSPGYGKIYVPVQFGNRNIVYTVEHILKDHPIGHKYLVSQDRWSLVTGSVTPKCGTRCQECVVFHGSGLSRQVSL